jgi:cytochrome P450
MRLFPPAWVIGREAINDYEAGGYKMPAGSVITMSQYVVHRDPRWFPQPKRFDPMRWTPEEKAKRPKYSYFPFGGGNRLCIGEPFAWMEGVLVLATLAQQWQARLVPGHKIGTLPRVTLRPKGGMPMILQRRKTPTSGLRASQEREEALAY